MVPKSSVRAIAAAVIGAGENPAALTTENITKALDIHLSYPEHDLKLSLAVTSFPLGVFSSFTQRIGRLNALVAAGLLTVENHGTLEETDTYLNTYRLTEMGRKYLVTPDIDEGVAYLAFRAGKQRVRGIQGHTKPEIKQLFLSTRVDFTARPTAVEPWTQAPAVVAAFPGLQKTPGGCKQHAK